MSNLATNLWAAMVVVSVGAVSKVSIADSTAANDASQITEQCLSTQQEIDNLLGQSLNSVNNWMETLERIDGNRLLVSACQFAIFKNIERLTLKKSWELTRFDFSLEQLEFIDNNSRQKKEIAGLHREITQMSINSEEGFHDMKIYLLDELENSFRPLESILAWGVELKDSTVNIFMINLFPTMKSFWVSDQMIADLYSLDDQNFHKTKTTIINQIKNYSWINPKTQISPEKWQKIINILKEYQENNHEVIDWDITITLLIKKISENNLPNIIWLLKSLRDSSFPNAGDLVAVITEIVWIRLSE